jgi:hypothetical protein
MWLENIVSPPPRHPGPSVREAVGVFDNPESLQMALDELEQEGFMRQELSILAPDKVVAGQLGRLYNHVGGAVDDPRAPRGVFVPDEIIGEIEGSVIGLPMYVAAIAGTAIVAGSGGTLLAAIAAAGVAGAAGAGIGSILAKYIAKHHAEQLQAHLERGGIVLWAAVRDPEQEKKARRILARHSARDVHIHEIPLHP